MLSQAVYLDINTPVTTAYTYNSFGEPLGNTTNTYDANGNLLTVAPPAPNGTTSASVTHFAYDTKGELTQITDPLSHITTLAYNTVGLISTITDAQSNVTGYEYDLRGNRTAVVDAQQNRTTFTYDAGNRLTKITYPDSTSVSFAYNSRGRRTSVIDQNSKVTAYAYDDADRLLPGTDAAQNVTLAFMNITCWSTALERRYTKQRRTNWGSTRYMVNPLDLGEIHLRSWGCG